MEKLVPVKPNGWQKSGGGGGVGGELFGEESAPPLGPFEGRCGGTAEDIFAFQPS